MIENQIIKVLLYIYSTYTSSTCTECTVVKTSDGSVGPVSRYQEHFTEIP